MGGKHRQLDGAKHHRQQRLILADNFFFVVGFAFFYTDVLFQQQNYGENLKRSGAQIPGVSRGAPTQAYLTRVLRRITFPGALFLGVIAVLPYLVTLVVPDLAKIGGGGVLPDQLLWLADRCRCGP